MDDTIEFLLELLLEGSIEVSKSKKVPKWIRYPVIVLLGLLCSLVLLFMIYLGLSILRDSIIFGSIILLITFVLIIMGIKKIKRYMKKEKN